VLEKNRAPQSEKEDGEEAHRVVCAFKSARARAFYAFFFFFFFFLFYYSFTAPSCIFYLSSSLFCRSSLTKKKENAKKQHKKGEQISSHEGPSKERD